MPMPGRRGSEDDARLDRIREFETYMERYPGAAPNGTGSTGLMSGDARGYSELLNRQKRYLDDKNAVAGRGPMAVRDGGSMTTSRRPAAIDELEAFAERSRNPFGPVVGGGIDLGRSMDLENLRGARIRNRGADASVALAESEGLPYGTPEQRTAMSLKRRGAEAEFGREQGAKDFGQRLDQKFTEYFDPRNESMNRLEDARADARVSHGANEQRRTLFGRDQIEAGGRVGAEEVESGQRSDEARMNAIIELLKLAGNQAPAMPGAPENPVGSRALAMLDRLESGGAIGGDPGKTVSRAEVEAFARERQRDPEQVARELQAKGYAIR
jgi:hypothetical protein